MKNRVPNGCFQQYLPLISGLSDGVYWSRAAVLGRFQRDPIVVIHAGNLVPKTRHLFIKSDCVSATLAAALKGRHSECWFAGG